MKTTRRRLDTGDRQAVRNEVVEARASRASRVCEDVAEILGAVRLVGDAALVECAKRFDTNPTQNVRGVAPAPLWSDRTDAAMSARQQSCLEALAPHDRLALDAARANIRTVADAWRSSSTTVGFPEGHSVQLDEIPVRRAAICVPGGQAPYVSTVLMGVETARAAGVEEVVVCTPAGVDGRIHDVLLAVFGLVEGVEIVHAGGAHAVAALAYGTETIAPVDVIAGPGGDYVQEAKRQVVGVVGIDGIAGPSELVLVIDTMEEIEALSLDLAAQAEHRAHTTVVAVSTEDTILDRLEQLLAPYGEGEEERFADCTLLSVPDMQVAETFVDLLAPEHVQLAGPGAEELAACLPTAGCVFVGTAAGTAFGDYVAGSNHVLPTGGAGRFASVLNPGHFLRRRSTVTQTRASASALAEFGAPIAELEGFPFHARSMLARRLER